MQKFISLFCVFSLSSWNAFGFSDEDLKKLITTKECIGCNLTKADLSGLDLAGADLSNANLAFANCKKTNFSGANLSFLCALGTCFKGAIFDNANMSCSDFGGANFDGASLKDADARTCYFGSNSKVQGSVKGANFTGTDLRGGFFHVDESEAYFGEKKSDKSEK